MERSFVKELNMRLNMRKYVVIAVIVSTVVVMVGGSILGYSVYKWRTSLFFDFVPEGISMISPTEGWVVGKHEHLILSRPLDRSARAAVGQQSGDGRTVALHLHNGRWSRVPVPTELWHVFTVSADDAWASSLGDGLYHWNGSTWSKAPGAEAIEPDSLFMLSATDGWAVQGRLFWHFTGGRWIDASNLLPNDMGNVGSFCLSMLSADDGWAAGERGVILHYDGKVWKQVESPLVSDDPNQWANLTSISMVSPDEGWAAGEKSVGSKSASVILHYRDGKWAVARENAGDSVRALTMVLPGEGWAAIPAKSQVVWIGNFGTAFRGKTEILHYHDGHWTAVGVPGDEDIEEISMGSPSDGWALTSIGLLHYHAGVWEQFA